MLNFGPQLRISQEMHELKYRDGGESFYEAMLRISSITDEGYKSDTFSMLLDQRFLPGGRVQAAVGTPKNVTAFNCFVMQPIEDSLDGILKVFTRAMKTMQMGGGVGYDFSTIRPKGSHIVKLNTTASGPLSFMHIFDAGCGTIAAAGHRRGAQMAVLRIDHPDVEEFVDAKTNKDQFTRFNISVAVTDRFMAALESDDDSFDLVFEGKVHKTISARKLWDKIMLATWDWAEPGILFIDRINALNNLYYTEYLAATNPCGEQPLPADGACLLGSLSLPKYIHTLPDGSRYFNYGLFLDDAVLACRLLDNVIDTTTYPLPEQELEAKAKRRMGIGVTGLANAGEALGFPYGSKDFLRWANDLFEMLRDELYWFSSELAIEKGPFPLFDAEQYCDGQFIQSLPVAHQHKIWATGIRNSHLISFAPTGTISLSADNVSSGIEPVFSYGYERTIQLPEGPVVESVEDYGVRVFGVRGKTADALSPAEHIAVQSVAQKYCDSAVSKTCNIGPDVTFEEFKDVYMLAYKSGAKGCTTFRAAGKRLGVLNAAPAQESQEELEVVGEACTFDLTTGQRTCS